MKDKDTKKVKFVFDEANQNWASASEFWFYKEDKVINELSNLFTDSKKNALNEKYNTIEKLGAFESEANKHPMYNAYASDFNHAIELLNMGEVVYADAIVSKFTKID